jgi:hypothetical protein
MQPNPPTDAIAPGAENLLRAWYRWFATSVEAPDHLPDGLHIQTAAYLAARAVEDGRKIYDPRDL